MKRLSLEDLRSTQAKVMDSAAKLLDTFESRDILGKLPIELSGGKRAIARIVSALLVPTARVVFLDEALTNVDRDMRPTIIAQLRDWQRADVAEGRTIVAVSHHRDELLLWQPDGRFVIEDGQIAELAGSGYTSIHRAHPKHVEAIPIYTAPFKGGTLATFPGTPLLITTKTIQQNHKPVLDEIRASLLTISGEQPVTILVAGSEDGKNFKALGDLIEEILEKGTNHRRPGAIAVIGGGALLNMACLAAGLVFRRKCPLLVIPSTLTAISDIAIGSKTSVNYTTQTNRHLKNAIGAYVDPTAVVLDRRLLQTLPHPERRLGMVECLKHGLLQSPVLFEAVAKLVVEDAQSLDECFRIACEVLHLKSRVLLHHPWETGGGRILRFGHIHGHAMERVTGFAVCHSSSVLWGMLVELRLGRNVSEQAFERMIGVIMARKDFGQELWKGVKVRDVVEAERLDPHESVGPYSAVQVPIVGYYSTIPPQQVLEVEASEEEVLKAMYEVNKLL
jgi:3-dehydroquinate synthetase